MKTLLLITLLSISLISISASEKTVVSSDGVELHINIKGNGMPCLLVTVQNTNYNKWFKRFTENILEKNFQIIYLNLIDLNKCEKSSDAGRGIKQQINDIEEVRKSLGINNWYLLNIMSNNRLIARYTRKYPEKVSGVVYIDSDDGMKSSFFHNIFNRRNISIKYLQLIEIISGYDFVFI